MCFNCQWPYISASHVRLDMPFICMFTNIVYLYLFDFGYTKDL